MYSDRLKAIKEQQGVTNSNGATLGLGVGREQLDSMVRGFCTPDDACEIKHETLFNLFDEYCRENGYPIVNRQTLGRAFCSVLGLTRKKAQREGRLCWIYVKKI